MDKSYCQRVCHDVPNITICPVTLEPIDSVDSCPIQGPNSSLLEDEPIKFEIYYQDLNAEAQERLNKAIGKDHNYDVFPLAEVVVGRSIAND